ncbi:MAG TPA: hypothetical protein VFB92_17765 [Vicinamibacterales bacterium]|nr:hypothetical protein [Vicinamibacterales bacterium]
MNTFYEHHHDSIRFAYRCFDRILLNGLIPPFQRPERVVGFFNTYRQVYPVSKGVLRDIATQYQHWVTAQAAKWRVPILEAPADERRDTFVDPYFRGADPDHVVVILKAREPARYLVAIGKDDRWHLEYKWRWPIQYNFYLVDREWGRLFVRVCPYFPFSARVCLNQHHWLATRLRAEGMTFRQCRNAFLACSAPTRLQTLADSLTSRDLERCAQKWLRAFTPFFTPTERTHAACQHRLFLSQVEYCDNLIFRRRAALDALGERLFDANRTIGQPTKLAVIFGRKVTTRHRGKLETVIADLDLPNPVIRSYYREGSIKQYVRDHLLLRTEPSTNNVRDYGLPKAIEHLPALREKLGAIADRYLTVQQDILETFVDRGQLRQLAEPTRLPNGKRIPGLKLDHPRQLALMHALVRFAHIAAGDTFTTHDLHEPTAVALETTTDHYRLASLRYDLSKLRAKGLVERVPHSRRYRLLPHGYAICLLFLKLFERIYAPLTAGLLQPVTADARLAEEKRHRLDRLYQRIATDLDALLKAVGLRIAA